MKSHWMVYQGKQILYCDYANFALDQFEAFKTELDSAVAVITREPEKSLLALTDIRRSVASPAVVDMFKTAAIVTAKHIRKQAVVGVSGMKKILFDAVIHISKQPARAFGDLELEKAQKWLVED
ncbi:MAG TPA: hypothetical protein VJL29_06630 [Thermoguttaceae bacterium]|nr:hypothetical protein [Thermoguttaceae bacterium]